MYLLKLSGENFRLRSKLAGRFKRFHVQREVTQKNNLLSEKDTLIGEKDHRLSELVRQQEVRLPVMDFPVKLMCTS